MVSRALWDRMVAGIRRSLPGERPLLIDRRVLLCVDSLDPNLGAKELEAPEFIWKAVSPGPGYLSQTVLARQKTQEEKGQ